MSNTTADKLALAAANKTAIKAAIVAKNPATAPTDVMSQWPTAIASIPSGGGGSGWQKPADWPDIKAILNADTDTTYTNKTIWLLDSSVQVKYSTAYGSTWGSSGPQRIRLSDGTVINNPSGYQINLDPNNGRFQWAILENNRANMIPIGPGGSNNYSLGILWVYGPNATVSFYNCYSLRGLRSVEVKYISNENCMGNIGSEGNKNEKYSCLENISCTNCISGSECFALGLSNLKYASGEYQGFYTPSFENNYLMEIVPNSFENIKIKGIISYMFKNCWNLRSIPHFDFSNVNLCSYLFSHCHSLQSIPENIDLTTPTSFSNIFDYCFSLKSLPQNFRTNLSVNFSWSANPQHVSNFDKDSVATFDSGGVVNGGFVYTIKSWDCTSRDDQGNKIFQDDCPNSGQTITFGNYIKALFTTAEWDAIKAALTAKNWGCSPA